MKNMARDALLYARVSTEDQNPERQLDDLRDHLEQDDYQYGDVAKLVDIDTGTTAERTQFSRLVDEVRTGGWDVVVVTELSRLSRTGAADVMEFVELCISTDTGLEVLDSVIEIDPSAPEMQQSVQKLIASLMSELAALQHRQKMERIQSGIRSAQDAGKWTGAPPTGFSVEDGRLRVVPEEYLNAREAVRRVVEDGNSKRSVARETGISRATLRKMVKDRRELYLAGDAADDRVQEAIDDAQLPEDR